MISPHNHGVRAVKRLWEDLDLGVRGALHKAKWHIEETLWDQLKGPVRSEITWQVLEPVMAEIEEPL